MSRRGGRHHDGRILRQRHTRACVVVGHGAVVRAVLCPVRTPGRAPRKIRRRTGMPADPVVGLMGVARHTDRVRRRLGVRGVVLAPRLRVRRGRLLLVVVVPRLLVRGLRLRRDRCLRPGGRDPREAATRAARARSPAPWLAPTAAPPPAARGSPPTPSRRAPARSSRRPSNWRARRPFALPRRAQDEHRSAERRPTRRVFFTSPKDLRKSRR